MKKQLCFTGLVLFLSFMAVRPAAAKFEYRNLVEATPSNSSPYPNEPVLITYTLYTRVDVRYEGFEVEPSLPFQWFETQTQKPDIRTEKVEKEGLNAIAADVKKLIVYPMKPGTFTLEPGTANLSYRLDRRDKEATKDQLAYPPVMLTVREFPAEGKPADFTGMTGKFELASKSSVIQKDGGDYIQLVLEVSGEGNIRQMPVPSLDLPQDLLIHETKSELKTKWSGDRFSGTKKFTLLLQPQKTGVFKISEPHFSTFDAAAGKYISIKGKTHEETIAALPRPGQSFDVKQSQGNKIKILLDVSGSMMALDFKPKDRIGFAKESLKELLSDKRMQPQIVGVSIFARENQTLLPFNINKKENLDSIQSIEIGKQADGTAIGSALYEAVQSFEGVKSGKKFILLVTDGDQNAGYIDGLTAAHMAKDNVIQIYCVGIGKGGKVPFRIKDDDFGDREIDAEVKINMNALNSISELTQGKAYSVKSEQDFKNAIQELAGIFSA